jgi:hypothetical protein
MEVKEDEKLIHLSSSRHLLDTAQTISSYCFPLSLRVPGNCTEFPSIELHELVTLPVQPFSLFQSTVRWYFLASWRRNTLADEKVLKEWNSLYVSTLDSAAQVKLWALQLCVLVKRSRTPQCRFEWRQFSSDKELINVHTLSLLEFNVQLRISGMDWSGWNILNKFSPLAPCRYKTFHRLVVRTV